MRSTLGGCRDEFLGQAELLGLGVGEDERGVDVRLLGLLAAHLQVDELNVGGRLVGGRDDGDVLGGVGPDEGVHCLLDGLLLPNITQTSSSSMRLGELGRALDGRDVVNERLGRLAVQLGLLEDDERLLVQLRADGDWRCRACRSIVEPVDVVHGLDGGQDEQVPA